MSEYKTPDPYDLVQCPYDPAHMIDAKRFQRHLVKCGKQHPNAKVKTCPFNARHVVPSETYVHHLQHCPDKHVVITNIKHEQQKTQRYTGDCSLPNDRWEPPPCTENWDDEIDESRVFRYGDLSHTSNRNTNSSAASVHVPVGMHVPETQPFQNANIRRANGNEYSAPVGRGHVRSMLNGSQNDSIPGQAKTGRGVEVNAPAKSFARGRGWTRNRGSSPSGLPGSSDPSGFSGSQSSSRYSTPALVGRNNSAGSVMQDFSDADSVCSSMSSRSSSRSGGRGRVTNRVNAPGPVPSMGNYMYRRIKPTPQPDISYSATAQQYPYDEPQHPSLSYSGEVPKYQCAGRGAAAKLVTPDYFTYDPTREESPPSTIASSTPDYFMYDPTIKENPAPTFIVPKVGEAVIPKETTAGSTPLTSSSEASLPDQAGDDQKQARKLQKKLREIESLEQKLSEGVILQPEQVDKIGKKADILAALKDLNISP